MESRPSIKFNQEQITTLAEDARELYRMKERLQYNLVSVTERLARSRRDATSLRTQYLEVSNLLAVKRGRRTFEDVVRSQGADAAESALDAEIVSVGKTAAATAEVVRELKMELEVLIKNHDADEPLKVFREAFRELLVIADVPEFSNADTWKLSKRPTDSGSPGPRSVVAYYGALWTVMKSTDAFLPSPIVIDSPNQNAQDRKHLERVMGMLASKTPANAQVILCAEDPSDAFKPDQVIQLERERALLESGQMEEVSTRVLPLVERAIAELARVQG